MYRRTNPGNAVVIVTDKTESIFSRSENFIRLKNKYPIIEVISIHEHIDDSGKIISELSEPGINPILRTVFKIAPEYILIHLKNADKNPSHEINLKNILKGAGFKNINISSSL